MSSAPRDLLDADCAYDVLAPAYDLLTAGLAGRRALDVACGTGRSLEALLELGFEVLGSDASSGMADGG